MLRSMFFALVTFSFCLANARATPIDKVVAAHYAPLMIKGNEDRPGYAIEVLREAAKRAGREIDLTFLPFERAMFTVRNDPATLMPALFYGKKRNDDFMWLVELQSAQLGFATMSVPINDIEHARTATSIVVERGATSDVFLQQQGFQNLVRVGTPDASALMLTQGRVDAWFQNFRAIENTWQQLALPEAPTLGDVIHEIPIFLVASPTLPEDVANAYQSAVASMKQDGTLDAMWERYLLP